MTPGEAFGWPETWDLIELPARYQRRPLATLPPDLTYGGGSVENAWCGAQLHLTDANGDDVTRWCTRRPGHSGRHAAGTGETIIAVWP